MDGVILVDNGDAIQGTPITRYNVNSENGVNNQAVAFAVHVRGGVDTDGDGLLPVLRERGDTQAAQRHQQAQEQGREPPRVGDYHPLQCQQRERRQQPCCPLPALLRV